MDGSQKTNKRLPLALYALALGAFAIGTTELVVVGLLPEVAGDLAVTIPAAGLLVTGYALGVVFGGPILTVATVGLQRKRLLLALMAVFIAGSVISALAPSYTVLMSGRIVTAFAHGTFFGVASVVAANLVAPGRRGAALGLLATGLTVSTVIGVPFGTLIGQQLGWRAAFWLVALLGTLALIGIAALVPRERGGETPRLRAEISSFSRPQVLLSLAMTALGFGGVFTSFTYIAPLLREVSGYSPGRVTILLIVFGAGSVVGTMVGGRLADRRLDLTLIGSFAALALTLAVFTVTVQNQIAAAVTVFVFGVVGYAAIPGLASRILQKAGDAPTLASTANASAFNVGNAGGAFIGGAVIGGGLGLVAVNWAGAIVAISGVAVTVLAVFLERRANLPGRSCAEETCV